MASNPNRWLMEAVERVLQAHGPGGGKRMPLRQAEAMAGVSSTTIYSMTEGRVPGCECVMRFARAFGEDVIEWLEHCDYADIAQMMSPAKIEPANEIEQMIQRVPVHKRPLAREAARKSVELVIVPLLS